MIGPQPANARKAANPYMRRAPKLCAFLLGAAAASVCATSAIAVGADVAGSRGSIAVAPRSARPFGEFAPLAQAADLSHFTYGYESLVTQFLTDASAESGRSTNPYAVSAQYGQGSPPNTALRYHISFSPSDVFNEFGAYPPDQPHGNSMGCLAPAVARGPSDPPYTWCLTDAQIQQEISSVIAANGLPSDLSAIYFVLLAPGVDVCYSPGPERPNGVNRCADTDICGYHGNFAPAGPVYAVLPYAGVSGCESGQAPNGEPAADSVVSLLSHEHNDAITDPLLGGAGIGAWYEGENRVEVSDKCAEPYLYGAVVPGTNYNQTINSHHYYLQDEFADTDGANTSFDGCEQRPGAANDGVSASADRTPLTYHGGPVVGAHTVYVIFWEPQTVHIVASSSSAHIGQSVSFSAAVPNATGALTYTWDFGDGSGVTTLTPTATHAFTSPGSHTITLTVAGQTATQPFYVLHDPSVTFTHPKDPVLPGQRISFDAGGSTDPDGTIASWQWSFGDGTGGSGKSALHAYTLAGNYNVTLTELDNNGSIASASARMIVRKRTRPAARLLRTGRPSLLRARNRLLLITGRSLRCYTARCAVSMTALARLASRPRWIGAGSMTVRAGRTARLRIALDRAAGRLLLRTRRVRVKVTITVHARGAADVRSVLTLTLA